MSSSLHLDEEDFVAAAWIELVKYKLWQIKVRKSKIATLGTTKDLEYDIHLKDWNGEK